MLFFSQPSGSAHPGRARCLICSGLGCLGSPPAEPFRAESSYCFGTAALLTRRRGLCFSPAAAFEASPFAFPPHDSGWKLVGVPVKGDALWGVRNAGSFAGGRSSTEEPRWTRQGLQVARCAASPSAACEEAEVKRAGRPAWFMPPPPPPRLVRN